MLRHGGASLIPTLNNAGSAAEAARIFMERWERPGIPALAERENAARRAFKAGYKTGGSPTRDYLQWRGDSPNGLQSGIKNFAAFLMNRYSGLSLSDGYATSGHEPGSLHYSGQAVDLIGGDMNNEAAWIGAHYGSELTEGIHNPTLSIKDGQHVDPSYWGEPTWAEHRNHIHLAMTHPWKGEASKGSGSAGGKASAPKPPPKEQGLQGAVKGDMVKGKDGNWHWKGGKPRTHARDVVTAPPSKLGTVPNSALGLPARYQRELALPGLDYASKLGIGMSAEEDASEHENEKGEKAAATYLLSLLRPRKKFIQAEIRRLRSELLNKNLSPKQKAHKQKLLREALTRLHSVQQEINAQKAVLNQAPEAEEAEPAEEPAAAGQEGPTHGEQLASLSRARYELFNQFANNIAPIGQSLLNYGASAAAFGYNSNGLLGRVGLTMPGNQDFGGPTSGVAGRVQSVINNYFAAPPPDPHTWTRQQAYEVAALA